MPYYVIDKQISAAYVSQGLLVQCNKPKSYMYRCTETTVAFCEVLHTKHSA